MFEFVSSLLQVETMITILVGMAAFATVLTVTAPFLETVTPGGQRLLARDPAKLKAELKAQREAGVAVVRDALVD